LSQASTSFSRASFALRRPRALLAGLSHPLEVLSAEKLPFASAIHTARSPDFTKCSRPKYANAAQPEASRRSGENYPVSALRIAAIGHMEPGELAKATRQL
jgi:hypothetical protein